MSEAETIGRAYAHCAAEVRAHDRDRYLAALFAPAAKRRHLMALYAFDLEIHAIRARAREALPGEVRQQWWRDALIGGAGAGNPVAEALIDTLAATGLERTPLLGMLEARRFDLYDEPMPSTAELFAYADATAGAMIGTAAAALGGQPDATGKAVIAAGRLRVLTEVLRDFALHASRGQLYVPLDLLAAHGVPVEDVFAGRGSDALVAALRALGRLAEGEAGRLRSLVAGLDPTLSAAFLPSLVAPIYLAALERRDYAPFASALDAAQWKRQWRMWREARGWRR